MRAFVRPARRPCLTVRPLEGRVVLNGTITASLSSTGAVTLIGDDDSNGATLGVTAGALTITGDATTSITFGGVTTPPNTPVPLGLARSIKADLKGGADTLDIDGLADFVFAGPVALGLGDGDNTLALDTTGRLTLGGLTVTAGEGQDAITVQGGAGSTVGGTATFKVGAGGSDITLGGVTFGAVTVSAGDAATNGNSVTGIGVVVTRTVTAALSNSHPGIVDFTASTLGALMVSGFDALAVLTASTVNGATTVKGGSEAGLVIDGATLTGTTTVTGPNANFLATGAGSTLGNLTVSATAWTSTTFATSDPTEVKGNLTAKGGWYSDAFSADANFQADKNVTLFLGDGDNLVTIGDGPPAVAVTGNLLVTTGAGNDEVSLIDVAVGGTTTVKTGGGADRLSIDDGSTFAKTFAADLGAGDDTISVAQDTSAPDAVTFQAKATFLGGAGNDTLFLGVSQLTAGGSPTSKVSFANPLSKVDGGLGLDTYDPTTAQVDGVTPVGWEKTS